MVFEDFRCSILALSTALLEKRISQQLGTNANSNSHWPSACISAISRMTTFKKGTGEINLINTVDLEQHRFEPLRFAYTGAPPTPV